MKRESNAQSIFMIYRALGKIAYCVNYVNIRQDTQLFKFQCVSCMENKINIMHLMIFHSIMSEMLYLFHVYIQGKTKGNPISFLFRHVRFIMYVSQIFVTAF